MASLFGRLASIARSPKGQQMVSQATHKAQELAKDPRTRAKIHDGVDKVRAEVAKRRDAKGGTTYPTGSSGEAGRADPSTGTDTVTPG